MTPVERVAYLKNYRLTHKEEKAAYDRKYSTEHKKEIAAKSARYHTNHPDKTAASFLKWHIKELRNNPGYRMRCHLRSNLNAALKRQGMREKDVGKFGIRYSEIIAHLGPKPNDGKKYHVDHIKPLKLFDLTDPEQVKVAFAPSNHQWLTAEENMAKRDNYGV